MNRNYDRSMSRDINWAKFETGLAVNPRYRRFHRSQKIELRGSEKEVHSKVKRDGAEVVDISDGGRYGGNSSKRDGSGGAMGKNGNFIRVNSERYAERVTRLVIGPPVPLPYRVDPLSLSLFSFISFFTPSSRPEKFLSSRLKNNSASLPGFRFFFNANFETFTKGDKLTSVCKGIYTAYS